MNTQIPASYEKVFYNLPIEAMWTFKNVVCLENTIFILGDPDVNYRMCQTGQLQSPDERVHETVTQFLTQVSLSHTHTYTHTD